MENESLQPILEKLESFDEFKIKEALTEVSKDQSLKEVVERRYLNLIKTLLNNKDATLDDFSSAFTRDRLKTILSDVFYTQAEKIEFVYLSEEEMLDVVNIIGAIVKNHVSIDRFLNDAKQAQQLNDVGTPLFSNINSMKLGIDKEVNAYPQGWYGQLCINMMKSIINGISEIVVLKSWLKKANQSDLLREFMFFLSAASSQKYIMLQYRNIMDEAFDHSPVLWLFPNMPLIMYPADYQLDYPNCILPFNRSIDVVAVENFYDEAGVVDLKRIVDTYELKTINSEEFNNL